jgi:hypothetical protein
MLQFGPFAVLYVGCICVGKICMRLSHVFVYMLSCSYENMYACSVIIHSIFSSIGCTSFYVSVSNGMLCNFYVTLHRTHFVTFYIHKQVCEKLLSSLWFFVMATIQSQWKEGKQQIWPKSKIYAYKLWNKMGEIFTWYHTYLYKFKNIQWKYKEEMETRYSSNVMGHKKVWELVYSLLSWFRE